MGEDTSAIPDFDANGNLPPGEYDVSLEQIKRRFVWNGARRRLFNGLSRALEALASAGVKRVWIDGSFTTAKEEPNDIDGCWEYEPSVDLSKLDRVFLETSPPRKAMKEKYGVDFLLSTTKLADAQGKAIRDFFQEDKDGNRKGLLSILMESQE